MFFHRNDNIYNCDHVRFAYDVFIYFLSFTAKSSIKHCILEEQSMIRTNIAGEYMNVSVKNFLDTVMVNYTVTALYIIRISKKY